MRSYNPARTSGRTNAVAAGTVGEPPVSRKVIGLPGGRGSPIERRDPDCLQASPPTAPAQRPAHPAKRWSGGAGPRPRGLRWAAAGCHRRHWVLLLPLAGERWRVCRCPPSALRPTPRRGSCREPPGRRSVSPLPAGAVGPRSSRLGHRSRCAAGAHATAWIDEAIPGGVDMRPALGVIAQVVGHGSGDDQDQAGARMRMPAGGPSRRELLVDDIDIGLPVGLEWAFQRSAVCAWALTWISAMALHCPSLWVRRWAGLASLGSPLV
jgi:hypothetical protein